MKPYVTMEEVISTQGADSRTHRFLTEKNGFKRCAGAEGYLRRRDAL